jgi:glycosyltransferase involved in cell wall biosynthesis
MKIVFVSLMSGFSWGGSEELWHRTALYARKLGNEVFTITKHWDTEHPKIQELKKNGVRTMFYSKPPSYELVYPVFTLKQRILRKVGLLSLPFEPRAVLIPEKSICEIVTEADADMIIFNQGGTFEIVHYLNLFQALATKGKKTFIISQFLHDFGKVLHISTIRDSVTVFNLVKNVFFVSQRNLSTAERLLGSPIKNAAVVNNPVNISSKSYFPFPSLESGLKMACVARIDCNFKGQDLLLETLASQKWKSRNWQLTFYGQGPDEDILHHLIQNYGLQEHVYFKGHVSNIQDIWLQNHLLVLSSIGEGTPLSLVEAMLCGRPAVVTNVGGNSELISENVSGFIAPSPLPFYLDIALDNAYYNQNRLEEMGKIAYDKAMSRYSEDAEVSLWNKIAGS